ncbi:MAG: hypothetical protein ACOY3K_07105 [Candidatus Omnitrophota bacterium]
MAQTELTARENKMRSWQRISVWVGVAGIFIIAMTGVYHVKSQMGIDFLKGRHLLVFQQKPKIQPSLHRAGSAWPVMQKEKITGSTRSYEV